MFDFLKKDWLPAKATIVMDEGEVGMAINSATVAKQQEKYIVDVHPENGDAPFRAEITSWVDWPGYPSKGDVVNAIYKPGTHKVDLVLHGDPRYDPKVKVDHKEAERTKLLSEGPDS